MSTGFNVNNNEHLLRTSIWDRQLKKVFQDSLEALKFVRILSYPDGASTLNIPSIGRPETNDFVEGQSMKYNRVDTGNFQFTVSQYKYTGGSISEKFKRDSFYAQDVISSFVPDQHRALMEDVEVRILSRGNAGQTASALNVINGANHRWVASGTSESMALKDFAMASFALDMANVPQNGRIAIVHPSVAYTLMTQTNIINLLTPQPQWAQMVPKGMVTGTRFAFQIYDFDVYVSKYLPSSIAETIDGRSTTVGVANQFFSVADDMTKPLIGKFNQMPTVHSYFDVDHQEERYATIMEYDFALFRPENMVVVLTDTNVVS